MTNLFNRLSLVMGVLVYIILLDWSYIHIISPSYKYMGFHYFKPTVISWFISYVLMMMPSISMPFNLKRPSLIIFWLLYVIVVIPSILIPLYAIQMSYDNILIFQFSLSILYILIAFIYKLPLIQVRKLKISYPLIWGIILFLNLLFSAYIVSAFGVSLNYFSFNEVYSIRANYISTLSRVGGLLPYIIGWQANILNPVIIIEGLMRRNYYYLMMGLVGQLIIYSITGFKSVFFSVVLIFLIYIITSFFKRDKIANIFLWGSAFSVLLAILTHFNNSNILSSLLLQRTIVMPGLLSGQYYQFFSENAKALLGHSIFRNIVQYPYSVQPPFLIGDFYYNSPSTEANANIWADAFANFGNWGIMIYTILFALVLWIYDSISKDLDYRFASMMLAVPSFTLANSSLLTSMLTHGILLCFIIIYLLPSTKYSNKDKNYSITNMINIIFKFMKEIKDVKSS